jgi:hypothetical protein
MKCYLGIDGGGSKTAFLLIDEAGNVLSSHTEGPAYYLEVGFEPMKEMLARGIAATLKPVGIWPMYRSSARCRCHIRAACSRNLICCSARCAPNSPRRRVDFD